jgi:hypothetical protein
MLCNQAYDTVHPTNHSIHWSCLTIRTHLQLSLRRLECRDKKISDISCSLIQVEAHSLTSETLRNNVELNAGYKLAAISNTVCG